MNYGRKNSFEKVTALSTNNFDFATDKLVESPHPPVPLQRRGKQSRTSAFGSSDFYLLCLIFIPCLLFSQTSSSLQAGQAIYSGNFKGGLYTYAKEDAAVQEKVQKVFEEAFIVPAMDEWDPNMSESWSITKSNFPNQAISILTDSALKHYMMCKSHCEFYPKSGTTIMNDYLKRQQQSLDNEKKVQQDLAAAKITRQQASEAFQNLDAAIWGAPSHIDIITNDFPLSDSAFILIDEPGKDVEEITVEGANYASVSTQSNMGNSFRVTTIYLGNYSKNKNGNLQLKHPTSLQWEKQNTIKLKIYGPDDVVLLLLKKFDLVKLKALLK